MQKKKKILQGIPPSEEIIHGVRASLLNINQINHNLQYHVVEIASIRN
jgi:hypothetical protein